MSIPRGRRLAAVVVLLALCCGALATLAFRVRAPSGPRPEASPYALWVETWGRWDGGWYQRIAQEGYRFEPGQQSPVAFFPAYPLTIRAAVALGVPLPLAGVLLTLTFGFAAAFVFSRWAATLSSPATAQRATLMLCVYPFVFYLYGAVYSDALFLLLATSAFLSVERGRPGWAAVLGALAAATRPVAPAIVLGLTWRSVERRRQRGEPVRVQDLLPLLSGVGLLAYMGFLWYRFGDPLAFAHVQGAPGWDQAPGPKTWFKSVYFESFDQPRLALRLSLHAGVTLVGLALVWPIARRLGFGYAAYVVVALGLPAISSKDFQGLGRYTLAAFPVFLALAQLLEPHPRLRRLYLAMSVGLLGVLTWLFGAGEYVS